MDAILNSIDFIDWRDKVYANVNKNIINSRQYSTYENTFNEWEVQLYETVQDPIASAMIIITRWNLLRCSLN